MVIIKLIDKFLNFILISFFIIAILFSGYALYDISMVSEDIKLDEDILIYKPQKLKNETTSFNLDELQQNVNEDICGWLKVDGTNIDYPIMYPNTPLEYLSKSYDGKYSVSGSVFVDIKNDRTFTDDYSVVYGHNVADKLMFADIKKFKDKDFFNTNKGGKLYIKNEIYDIKIISYNILDSNKDIAYKVDSYKNGKNDILINNFKKSAINKNNIEISENDNTIATVDKDVKLREAEKKQKRLEKSLKDYDPDKDLNKKKVINSNNFFENLLSNIEYHFMNIIYNYSYVLLIILLVITIIIYTTIFKMKKKIKDKIIDNIKVDDEII